jgi:hypothetical protein
LCKYYHDFGVFLTFQKETLARAVVAHACNPSYSGGLRFKANLGKQFSRPYLEKTRHKKGLVEWLKV